MRKSCETEQLTKFLKKYIKRKTTYYIYFKSLQIEMPFIKLIQHLFNNTVKFTKTDDNPLSITNYMFNKHLEKYHKNNHNGIQETYQHFKTLYYTPHMRVNKKNTLTSA